MYTGCTQGRSGPHAEVCAIDAAGAQSRGATLYVTLEPCAHHGATPPCADAVIAAAIRRVVIALEDPDPRVAGQGIARMRDAGIEVVVGVGALEAESQLAAYLHHRRTGRPLVVLKLAATLDGFTAAPDRSSQWITGPEARLDAHRLRADCDAILVGAGTVRADDPSLTVRLPPGEFDDVEHRQPKRFVLGQAPATAKVHPCTEVRAPLPDVLDLLGRDGVLQVMVEGGATVARDFHAAGLVDRYALYLGAKMLGGDDGLGMFHGPGVGTIMDAADLEITGVAMVGTDVRIDARPSAQWASLAASARADYHEGD